MIATTATRARYAVVVLMVAAAALQLSILALADRREHLGFMLQLIAAGFLPHGLVGTVAVLSRWTTVLLPAMVLMLLADVAAFLSVFVWPQDAQAPLLLLFMPLWNLLVVLPLGLLLSVGARYGRRRWRVRESGR